MDETFLMFAAVGFFAQLVDGALGMAYGVISSTVLLALGVPPAQASASVHAAEVFTTGASGASHVAHKNVDWALFWRIVIPGAIMGAAGAYLLTAIDGDAIRPFVTAYLALMGGLILWRAFRKPVPPKPPGVGAAPLGAVGGFLDAVGGGGWGPIVTSSLVANGGAPRHVIGTVNTAEFFVTSAISAAFIVALVTGHWEEAGGLQDHFTAVAGLVVGGLAASPFAGYVVKLAPPMIIMRAVGFVVLGLAAFQTAKIAGVI